MNDLTFAITCSTELQETDRLLKQILDNYDNPNIVVLWDMKGDIQVWDLVTQYGFRNKDCIKLFARKFDNDFAAHKNYLNSKCNTKWILQLDADELMTPGLMWWLEHQLKLVDDYYDFLFIPRINIVKGITDEYVESQGWKFQDRAQDWIQWPDYQGRLYKNLPQIVWSGKVHEQIIGYKMGKAAAVSSNVDRALIHEKTFERQQQQNLLYKGISR